MIIAGASGFVGKALAPLLAKRFRVIGLSRSERDGGDGFAEYRKCDLFSLKQAERALEGGEYAVYLVHNMMPSAKLTQGEFADLDLVCADNFARAASHAGIKQIVFLGGLCPSDETLSKHLESRVEVERVLAGHAVPVTTLRAGLILGGARSSFQIMARLVQRLPLMIHQWLMNRFSAHLSREPGVTSHSFLLTTPVQGGHPSKGARSVGAKPPSHPSSGKFVAPRGRLLVPVPPISKP